MALHPDELSMLRESLDEYVQLAAMGVDHRKANGGVLGYPSVVLLFSVIDAIGSFYEGQAWFEVPIGSEKKKIGETAHHFFILNSDHFGLSLTEKQIWDIYALSRSALTHNALLGPKHYLVPGSAEGEPFTFRNGLVVIDIRALLATCDRAVKRFLDVAADVVPNSPIVKKLKAEGERRAATRETGESTKKAGGS